MDDTDVLEMRVRTANWGPVVFTALPHAPVELELAPVEAPEVVVRFRRGVTSVPRELTAQDIAQLTFCGSSGRPLLGSTPEGAWSLLIEGRDRDQLNFYQDDAAAFPSDATLARLAERIG